MLLSRCVTLPSPRGRGFEVFRTPVGAFCPTVAPRPSGVLLVKCYYNGTLSNYFKRRLLETFLTIFKSLKRRRLKRVVTFSKRSRFRRDWCRFEAESELNRFINFLDRFEIV